MLHDEGAAEILKDGKQMLHIATKLMCWKRNFKPANEHSCTKSNRGKGCLINNLDMLRCANQKGLGISELEIGGYSGFLGEIGHIGT